MFRKYFSTNFFGFVQTFDFSDHLLLISFVVNSVNLVTILRRAESGRKRSVTLVFYLKTLVLLTVSIGSVFLPEGDNEFHKFLWVLLN